MNLRLLIIAVFSGLLFVLLVGILIPGRSIEAKPVDTGAAIPRASIGPNTVSIDGPLTGAIDVSYTFLATVNPVSATLPISYTWEATGQSPVNHTDALNDTASFTWSTSGTQVITVTAANNWGTITATRTITISHPPIDVAVVFDVSGSMDFETNCFGCWNEDPALSADIMGNPFPSNGNFNPLAYNDPPDGNPLNDVDIFWGGDKTPPSDFGTNFSEAGHPVCGAAPSPVVDANGFRYSVHEAEFYATNFPLNGWEFEKRIAGQGFWVLQRTGRGSNGSYIRPHSFVTYSQNNLSNFPRHQGGTYNVECFAPTNQCWKQSAADLGEDPPNNNPPYVEYDFTVDWDSEPQSNTHIWIRAIGGNNWSLEWFGQIAQEIRPWQKSIYWMVDPPDPPALPPPGGVRGGSYSSPNDMGGERDIVNDGDWRWVKIGHNIDLANGQHTLRLYQGSAGFNLDKIIITNNPDGFVGTAVNNDGTIVGGGSLPIAAVLALNGGEGPDATAGSATREACNMCLPAFGETVNLAQCSCKTGSTDLTTGNPDYPAGGAGLGCTSVITPTNQLENDLFHDVDPLRSAQEAVKNFAARLDPKFDQIGLVAFSDTITQPRVKLHCLRYAEMGHAGPGGVAKCFDPASDPISFTNVIQAVEDHSPGKDGTDISEGMREGLEELGISVPTYNENVQHGCSADTSSNGDKEACDRQGTAQRVLIMVTDGAPNGYAPCPSSYHWRGLIGANTRPYDCAMFFANQAADNNVAVFTVGIGAGVDPILLTAMATGTDPNPVPGDDGFYFVQNCGRFFPALRPHDLDAILEIIRVCAIGGGPPAIPYIWSLSGYYQIRQTDILKVHLERHSWSNRYDIYLEDADGAAYRICSNVQTNPDPDCSLFAAGVPAGLYELYSTVAGITDTRVATATHSVDVIAGGDPFIEVEGGTIWAANETTQLTLYFHPVIPGTTYDVKLFAPDGATVLQTIATNHSGLSTDVIDWLVPDVSLCPAIGPDYCTIKSLDGATVVAEVEVKLNQPQIVMSPPSDTDPDNGIAYVHGETVNIFLRAHTPGKRYDVELPPNSLRFPSIDTNAVGDTVTPIVWTIPQDCGFGNGLPNGSYTATSHPLGKTPIIASTNFEVFSDPDPTLTIDGGTTWTAGSTINIRVLQHLTNTTHYLEFDGARIPTAAVDDTFMTDSCGDAVISFTIAPTTTPGIYTIRSFVESTGIEQAAVDVNVLAKPFIRVVEGSVVLADQTITIEGTSHIPHHTYAIYYANKFLQGVLADSSGAFSFTYDLNTLPTTPPPDLTDVNNLGIPYILKSQTVVAPITDVATTTLTLEVAVLYLPIIMKQ